MHHNFDTSMRRRWQTSGDKIYFENDIHWKPCDNEDDTTMTWCCYEQSLRATVWRHLAPALWCTGGYVWGQGLNMKWEIMWIVDVIIFIRIGLSLGLRKRAIISMRSHNNNDNSSYVQCMTSFPQCVLINCPGRIYWHCHTCHGGI